MKNLRYIFIACTLLMGASLYLDARVARIAPRTRIEARHNAPDSVVSVYIGIDPVQIDRQALERAGATVMLECGDLLTARVPNSKLPEVAAVKGVTYLQTDGGVRQMLDLARAETGADQVRVGTNLPQGFTGKGVVVGVVDRGFDYTHPAFTDADGKLRIRRVWEQGAETGTAPDKFGYGTEFATEEAILRAAGDIRSNSHGTHVAAIAAGSDHVEADRFIGVAPEADIVLVSLKNDDETSVNISNAVAYIFDYAQEQGKPCVINLSLGSQDGPHDGTSPFDRLADALQGPGRIIVGAAGNYRADKFHAQGSSTFRTFIDFRQNVTSANAGGQIDVWGAEGRDIEVALVVYNVNTGKESDRVKVYPSEETEVSLGRNVSGNVAVASETNPVNNKAHVAMTSGITALRNNYAVAIEVASDPSATAHIWTDNIKLGLSSRGMEGFTDGDASTISEIGGTGKRIITVGAYTTRDSYTPFNETEVKKLDETNGTLTSFSSNGPTADGRVKPQVSAPGCYIASAISSHDATGRAPVAYSYQVQGGYARYGYMQGTSMSSPFVAGVIATWLQACPDLTPEQALDVIKHTSRTDSFTGAIPEDGSNDWGFGKIDAYAGLKECLSIASIQDITNEDTPITYRLDGKQMTVLFGIPSASATIDIYDLSGRCVLTRTLSPVAPAQEEMLNLTSLPRGLYLLTLRTPSTIQAIKFPL